MQFASLTVCECCTRYPARARGAARCRGDSRGGVGRAFRSEPRGSGRPAEGTGTPQPPHEREGRGGRTALSGRGAQVELLLREGNAPSAFGRFTTPEPEQTEKQWLFKAVFNGWGASWLQTGLENFLRSTTVHLSNLLSCNILYTTSVII